MSLQLASNTVGLDIEDDDRSINTSGCKKITFAVESHADRMTTAEAAGCWFGVILLKDKGVDECEIHCAGFRLWEVLSSLSNLFSPELIGERIALLCIWLNAGRGCRNYCRLRRNVDFRHHVCLSSTEVIPRWVDSFWYSWQQECETSRNMLLRGEGDDMSTSIEHSRTQVSSSDCSPEFCDFWRQRRDWMVAASNP